MSRLLLVPLEDVVVFPGMSLTLAIEAGDEERVLLVPRHESEFADVGTVAEITDKVRLPGGGRAFALQGLHRGVAGAAQTLPDGRLFVEVDESPDAVPVDGKTRNLEREYRAVVEEILEVRGDDGRISAFLRSISEPGNLADTSGYSPDLSYEQKVLLLQTLDVTERLEMALGYQRERLAELQVRKRIRDDVESGAEKQQREYFLRKQMDSIRKELDEDDASVVEEYRTKIEEAGMPEHAREQAEKELGRLERMGEQSGESSMIRSYLDWLIAVPWSENSEEKLDPTDARAVLDADHAGLDDVKDRIVEYIAVKKLRVERGIKEDKRSGAILTLIGPPGTGKTSIGESIARATGRKFVRMSLGGVRDEAEIRGHRRTYIGALPGKIIQNLKKVGSNNPVFLLDEIDKMSTDFRGDPAAALLEVLDPEQNKGFNDHYLDLDYDLSDVMFITTANTLGGIPLPLQDRMEIIQLTSYNEFEKLNIAQKYLIPRQKKECGLVEVPVEFTENAVRTVIHHYTREAGVRSLERELASVCRKVALKVVKEGKDQKLEIRGADVPTYLGVPKFRLGKKEELDAIGLTHGLSVSDHGGDILDCEVSVVAGKGKLVITGLLEKGMEESAQAAMSYIRSRSTILKLESDFYQKVDVHVHFPDFVRKDGPSAGVTMATSIASALTRVPVRNEVAMTGEITLRGRVMPIGGLKEKILAAHRNGITTVLVPKENRKDLREIPRRVLKTLRVVLVEHMDDVLREAMVFPEPDTLFGPRRSLIEYRNGELIEERSEEHTSPSRVVLRGEAPGEQPGLS